MSNYIELAVLGISALCLVLGILLGFLRGGKRSVLRLVMIVLCVVAAFLLKDIVTELILTHEIVDAETNMPISIEQWLINQLPEEVSQLGTDFLLPLLKLIVGVVLFLALFLVLQLVTWLILFPIFKLILGKSKRKNRLVGSVFGLVQGVAVALCICIPVTGLLAQVNKLAVSAQPLLEQQQTATAFVSAEPLEGEPTGGDTSTEGPSAGGGIMSYLPQVLDMYAEYEQSVIGKTFLTYGETPFRWISSLKTEDERELTLSGQVDATVVLVNIFTQLLSCMDDLSQIDFSDLSSFAALNDVFAKFDEATADLPQEVKNTLNGIVGSAIDAIPVSDNVNDSTKQFVEGFKEVLKKEDFTEVGFANEMTVITNVSATLEKDDLEVEDLSNIIDNLSQSKVILPILENSDSELDLSNRQKKQLETAFEQLPEDTDQEAASAVRKILGLSPAN